MNELYKDFSVTGVINTEVLDGGLTSPEGEDRHLESIIISASAYQGNLVVGYIEREKLVSIYDYVLPTHVASGTNQYPTTNKLLEIPINRDIPAGRTFKIGIKSGGTATDIYGAYKYRVI